MISVVGRCQVSAVSPAAPSPVRSAALRAHARILAAARPRSRRAPCRPVAGLGALSNVSLRRRYASKQASCLQLRCSLGLFGHLDAPGTPAPPGAGLSPELRDAINAFITENRVVAFIKGTKQFPSCGFSNTVVQILNTMGAPYVTVNVLEDELLRSGMKEYSQWPTFPQVYIAGEFYGGADILIASYTSGELAETLETAMNS